MTSSSILHSGLVILSGFTGYCLTLGASFSFGVYYVELVQALASSRQVIAWLSSINLGLMYLISPLTSRLVEGFGPGKVMLAGAVLSITGHILSSVAWQPWHLVITYGVITGIGFGLSMPTSMITAQIYFHASPHLYVSVIMVSLGTAAGIFIFPPLFEILIEAYGWQSSMLIMSAVMAHMLPIAILFMSIPEVPAQRKSPQEAAVGPEQKRKVRNKRLELQDELRQSYDTLHHQCTGSAENELLENQNDLWAKSFEENEVQNVKEPTDLQESSAERVDVIFKTKFSLSYILFLGSWTPQSTSLIMFIQLVDHTVSQNVSLSEAVPLLLNIGIGNLAGRISIACIVHLIGQCCKTKLSLINYKLNMCYNACYGLAMILVAVVSVPSSGNLMAYYVFSFLFGFGFGGHHSSFPNMVLEFYGATGFSGTFSYSLVFGVIGTLVAPPLAGFIRDTSNSYSVSLCLSGILVLVGAAMVYLSRFINLRTYKKYSNSNPAHF